MSIEMTRQLASTMPPRETTARMGDLATLPVFFKLKGKRALVAGGSAGTAWKAELLAAAGAHIRLVWDEPDAECIKLAAEWPERVILIQRRLEDDDFDNIAIAIGALENDHEGAAFAATAPNLQAAMFQSSSGLLAPKVVHRHQLRSR
jgi:uroporphyrin-III C-methyltransferase / precorrin-2 dehydrogenase / sirohydrochlorin ferrochelatase